MRNRAVEDPRCIGVHGALVHFEGLSRPSSGSMYASVKTGDADRRIATTHLREVIASSEGACALARVIDVASESLQRPPVVASAQMALSRT